MANSILNGFLIFSIIQSMVFGGLFFSKKSRSTPDILMASWLFLFALQCLLILFNINFPDKVFLKILPINITLLYGPLLFGYVYSLSFGLPTTLLQKVGHLTPLIVFVLLSIVLYSNPVFQKALATSAVLSGLGYGIYTYFILNKHKAKIREHFSHTEKIDLNWIEKLVKGLLYIWLGVMLLVFLNRLFDVDLPLQWFFLCIPLFISHIGYYGLKQQVIFSFSPIADAKAEEVKQNTTEPHKNQAPRSSSTESYKKSGLDETSMKRIYETIQTAMEGKKLFLRPTLSLRELSEELNLPAHHITQTLNAYARKSFYDLVNSYRIEAFKCRIEKGEKENFSLLGIALDCGFNSKSSFNRIFKKSTGLSPSEYEKSIHNTQ